MFEGWEDEVRASWARSESCEELFFTNIPLCLIYSEWVTERENLRWNLYLASVFSVLICVRGIQAKYTYSVIFRNEECLLKSI